MSTQASTTFSQRGRGRLVEDADAAALDQDGDGEDDRRLDQVNRRGSDGAHGGVPDRVIKTALDARAQRPPRFAPDDRDHGHPDDRALHDEPVTHQQKRPGPERDPA